MAEIVDRNMQFYIRLLSVFIGVLLTGKWYRANYPEQKNVFLLVIVAVLLGLYANNV